MAYDATRNPIGRVRLRSMRIDAAGWPMMRLRYNVIWTTSGTGTDPEKYQNIPYPKRAPSLTVTSPLGPYITYTCISGPKTPG